MTTENDLHSEHWLPVPARAQHDEPISIEGWQRRAKAIREAEAIIAERLGQTL